METQKVRKPRGKKVQEVIAAELAAKSEPAPVKVPEPEPVKAQEPTKKKANLWAQVASSEYKRRKATEPGLKYADVLKSASTKEAFEKARAPKSS